MSNDNKYGRLYPEWAVAPARAALEGVLADLRENEGDPNQSWPEVEEGLRALREDGFPPDEPLFLLRGQDELAGEMVRVYAQMVRDHPQPSVRALDADHIDDHGDRMDNWTPRKLPD